MLKKTAPLLTVKMGGFLIMGFFLTAVSAAHGFDLAPKALPAAGVRVAAFVDREFLKPEDRFRLNVVVSLDPGWHIYSIETQGDPTLPTQILLETPGMVPDGDWQESQPTIANDQILERMVKVHLGRAEFKRDFVLAPELGPGHHPIRGVLKFRACDNRVCTLPRTIEFTTLIQIVPKDRV